MEFPETRNRVLLDRESDGRWIAETRHQNTVILVYGASDEEALRKLNAIIREMDAR
jgi:hypothetical protein